MNKRLCNDDTYTQKDVSSIVKTSSVKSSSVRWVSIDKNSAGKS